MQDTPMEEANEEEGEDDEEDDEDEEEEMPRVRYHQA